MSGFVISSGFSMFDAAPEAMAVACGPAHLLVYTNYAFNALPGLKTAPLAGNPVNELFGAAPAAVLLQALDRAHKDGCAVSNQLLGPLVWGDQARICTVWPVSEAVNGDACVVIALHPSTQLDAMRALQREVTERLLLSALRESDAADDARASQRRATHLADAGRVLAESIDEGTTHTALTGLSLPSVADWCIVDLIDADGTMHRLTIVHRDPRAQALVRRLQSRWSPRAGDPFGVPAVLDSRTTVQITHNIDEALEVSAHDPENLQVLRELGIGALLTTPLITNGNIFGAITFVGGVRTKSFTVQDVELADELAARGAFGLQKARLYTEALILRSEAQREAKATSTFLRSMSHELRTPLQAIAGFVEILERGIHGPVTPEQRGDLERIFGSQRHLTALIDDLLQFLRTGAGQMFPATTVLLDHALARALDVVGPLIAKKGLTCRSPADCAGIGVRADDTRIHQILINLMANAVKFTGSGGEITISCNPSERDVGISISDTGRGIPAEKLESIFEPFVQVFEDMQPGQDGLGLGLSISRELARAMGGDITVESTFGQGSTFTLTLPVAD